MLHSGYSHCKNPLVFINISKWQSLQWRQCLRHSDCVYFIDWLKWSSSVGSRSAFLSSPSRCFPLNRCLLCRPCCRAASSTFATCFSGFALRRGTRSWIPGSTSYSDVPYWSASLPGWTGPAAPSSASIRPSRRPSASSHAPLSEERLTVRITSGRIQAKPDKRIHLYLCWTPLRHLVPFSSQD